MAFIAFSPYRFESSPMAGVGAEWVGGVELESSVRGG
jgi:hypothetical protein